METHDQFLMLFLKHQMDIRSFIQSMVRDRHASEDMFQETALALFKGIGRYDPSRSFRAWAFGVAARKLKEKFKHDRKSPVTFSSARSSRPTLLASPPCSSRTRIAITSGRSRPSPPRFPSTVCGSPRTSAGCRADPRSCRTRVGWESP